MVSMTMSGLAKKWEKAKVKSSPFSAEQLRAVMGSLVGEDPTASSLANHRLAAMVLCLWHCVARFEEMSGVKLDQVKLLPGGSLELFIASAKNYGMGNPQTAVIAPSGRVDCPVSFVSRYIERVKSVLPEGTTGFLFPALSGFSIPQSKPVSYSACNGQWKATLAKVGLPAFEVKKLGLHSPRVGATSAAANHGLAIEVIQQAGRWQSVETPRSYIVANETSRGAVSALLGTL